MKREWFVLQTLTGQEQKVCTFIEAEKRFQNMEDYIGELLMPTERVASVKQGKKTTMVKKLYPGYVFVEVALYDAERKISEKVWSLIKGIQGVIGFLGGERPVPLTEAEMAQIRGTASAEDAKPRPRIIFDPGDKVKIIDGPFMSFGGTVEEVDPERGKLKVSVEIFGRLAPVELEYWQVERGAVEAPAPQQ